MYKRILILFILFIFTAGSIFSAVLKKEEMKIIENGEFNDDYFASSNDIEFNGKADDLFTLGRKIVFNGSVKNSFYSLGEKALVNGEVKNNYFGVGRTITITGKIEGTTLIVGQDVVIEKDALINGAVFTVCQGLEIKGTLNSDLYMTGASLDIDGKIYGNVKAAIGEINLYDNALINGDLLYMTQEERNIDKNKVKGTIVFKKENIKKMPKDNDVKLSMYPFALITGLLKTVILLIGGLLLLLFPVMKKVNNAPVDKNMFLYSVWGLIPFFIYPILIIVLFVLVVTIPFAFLTIMLGLPLLFLANVLGVVMIGKWLFRLFKFKSENRFLYFLFGLIPFAILSMIPFINILIMIFFASTGWGLLLEGIFQKKIAET
ncbi:MAG: polymer-forming cytoskeletal protein [Spirochaetes bacterium]|nr:polymer-forming cytoskeletal protein [Spirochaetota bacterium]